MPKGVYQRSPAVKAAMIARLNTTEARDRAAVARKANRPRKSGYALVGLPGRKTAMVHRVRAERALGKTLPKGAEVHHADGSKRPDAPLVICQDHAYHMLLHRRMKALQQFGDANVGRDYGDENDTMN